MDNDYLRKIKSLMQPMMLLHVEQEFCEPSVIPQYQPSYIVKCDIIGARDYMYILTIIVYRNSNIATIECNCPDYVNRHVMCKHIYWLCFKKMGVSDVFYLTSYHIDLFLQTWGYHIEQKQGTNETCPICLNNIDYITEYTINCVNQCRNSVHAICWKQYHTISLSNKCVFCRSETMPTL